MFWNLRKLHFHRCLHVFDIYLQISKPISDQHFPIEYLGSGQAFVQGVVAGIFSARSSQALLLLEVAGIITF